MDYIQLGRRIQESRKNIGLTQEELAEKVGISVSYLGQIERGERNVTLDTLNKICDTLRVSLNHIVRDSFKTSSSNFDDELQIIISQRSEDEKSMILQILKTMFSYIDRRN